MGPGVAVNKAAVYRAPRFGGTAAAGFSALAVGMARGVLAEWLAYTGPRTSRGVAIGAQQGMQILAARSAAEIDAAHALYQTIVRGGMRKLEEGGAESSAERLTGRRNIAFACQLSLKAGTRLFNAGGGQMRSCSPSDSRWPSCPNCRLFGCGSQRTPKLHGSRENGNDLS